MRSLGLASRDDTLAVQTALLSFSLSGMLKYTCLSDTATLFVTVMQNMSLHTCPRFPLCSPLFTMFYNHEQYSRANSNPTCFHAHHPLSMVLKTPVSIHSNHNGNDWTYAKNNKALLLQAHCQIKLIFWVKLMLGYLIIDVCYAFEF